MATSSTPHKFPSLGHARRLDRVGWVLMVSWAFLLACTPIWNWDFWWHLKTGQLILDRGHVPLVDWYTFTVYDRPWIDLHWGFQLMIALLHEIGGINLMVLLKASMAAAVLAIAWTTSGEGMPTWLKVVLWVFGGVCLDNRVMLRPELLTMVFLAISLWIYKSLPQRPRLIWLLPALQVLWTNCHGLFVFGFILYAAYVFDRIVRKFTASSGELVGPHASTLAIVGTLIALGAFCNPYFEEGVFFPLELFRKFSTDKEFYALRVGEFIPPYEFAKRYGILYVTLLSEMAVWLITVISFALLWRHQRSAFRLTLFAAFSYLGWIAWRNVAVFGLVSTTIACWNLQDYFRLRTETSRDSVRGPSWIGRLNNTLTVAVPVVLIAIVVSGGWAHIAKGKGTIGLGEQKNRFMHAACEFAGGKGFPDRAFLPWRHAGVYIYHNAPGRRVFMDGRLEVGTKRLYQTHDEMLYRMASGDRSWFTPLMDRTGQRPVVILDRDGMLPAIWGLLRNPEWHLVYYDSVGTVFLHSQIVEALKLTPLDGQELLKSATQMPPTEP